MDALRLLGLKLSAHVGTTADERRRGALLEIDCELFFPFAPAAAKDDLKKTADYSRVYGVILKEMEKEFHLLETAALRLAEKLGRKFSAEKTVVRVRKLSPPGLYRLPVVEAEAHWPKN
ncbi:MAG: dihydroneopterin aldolase [Candidatus Zixiibacteriota bacterium]